MGNYTVNSITENIGRQAIKVLYDNLNTRISSLSAGWIAEDATYFGSIGRSAPGYTVESITAENFYPGIVPSLITAPIENYPNCAAYAYLATPQVSRDDIGDFYTVRLRVEIMVKSEDSELEVNSRISRSLQAANAVMMENRTLNGLVPKFGFPRETKGDVFVRREDKSRGPRWFWQGGSLEYEVDKYVTMDV